MRHMNKTLHQFCPQKDVCGSCGWSHIPYEQQLKQKLADINGSFGLKQLDIECTEILPSPQTEHYRNRMDFVIDFEGRVGLRQKGKWWRVIDNHHCFLSMESIEQAFVVVRDWVGSCGLTFFDRKAHTGILRYAVIRATTTGEVMITIVTSEPSTPQEDDQIYAALEVLAQQAQVTTVVWSINHTISDVSFGEEIRHISGNGYITESINETNYHITPNAFFQTNSYGAAVLQNTVREFVGDCSEKTVLDLYCGSGFFAVDIARNSTPKKMIGVEEVKDAIIDARINAEKNNVEIEFTDAKTEEYNWMEHNADIVILDPPRSGMHDKALQDVIEAKPKTIVYVSCNYKNFAREMVQLQEYYTVTAIRAIDMFPHTPHVELVTRLERK